MEKIYQIISHIDHALNALLKAKWDDAAVVAKQNTALLDAIYEVKSLLRDKNNSLDADEAVSLINNCNAVCQHFLLTVCPEQALEAFAVQFLLPSHVDQNDPMLENVYIALKKSLDETCSGASLAWNAALRVRFIDSALSAQLGFTPQAMSLKSKLYDLKGEVLLRMEQPDKALFYLLESYSCLIDSIFQADRDIDETREKLLRNIRRCFEAKDNLHLVGWVQRKIEAIKARNGKGDTDNVVQQGSHSHKGWPCAAFAMESAKDAYEHIQGYRPVKHYGEGRIGHYYHTWDGGTGRHLCRCAKCGGYILVQRSGYHGEEDVYYGDYFPVSSPEEAEELNMKYDGWEIEDCFPGRYLIENGGPASWYTLHLQNTTDEKK